MTSKWHRKYELIRQNRMDCAASSFNLLGYTSWADSLYLAERTHNGLASDDALAILQRAYPGNNVKFRKVNSAKQIKESLKPGEATLGSLGWEREEGGEGGHFFVLHNDGSQILVIDPQTGDIEPLDVYVKRFKYPHYNTMDNLFMITSNVAMNGNNAVTQPLMNSVMIGRNRGRPGIRDRGRRREGRADDEVGSAYGRPDGRAERRPERRQERRPDGRADGRPDGRASEVGHNHGSSDGSYGVAPPSRRNPGSSDGSYVVAPPSRSAYGGPPHGHPEGRVAGFEDDYEDGRMDTSASRGAYGGPPHGRTEGRVAGFEDDYEDGRMGMDASRGAYGGPPHGRPEGRVAGFEGDYEGGSYSGSPLVRIPKVPYKTIYRGKKVKQTRKMNKK
jgi:hypothetical protein